MSGALPLGSQRRGKQRDSCVESCGRCSFNLPSVSQTVLKMNSVPSEVSSEAKWPCWCSLYWFPTKPSSFLGFLSLKTHLSASLDAHTDHKWGQLTNRFSCLETLCCLSCFACQGCETGLVQICISKDHLFLGCFGFLLLSKFLCDKTISTNSVCCCWSHRCHILLLNLNK